MHCFVRTRRRRMTAILRLQGFQKHIWQQIEDTLIVVEDRGIQEDGPCDSARKLFYNLLDNCTAKTMPNQDDLFQLVFLNAINNGGHTVSMFNADTCNPGAMAGERGRVCAMTLCRKVVNDFLPRPSAMPGS